MTNPIIPKRKRRPLPVDPQEQVRRKFLIYDALTANYVAAMWENKGDKIRAAILRDIRDRKLAEIGEIPPLKDTII